MRTISDYSSLDKKGLREALVRTTIGGATQEIDSQIKGELLVEYIRRAFPDFIIVSVQPTVTRAALNSVSGIITGKEHNEERSYFAKIHIESGTNSVSAAGVDGEYYNAGILARAGWPVIQPVRRSTDTDYPVLLYPVLHEPTLFDLLERSHLEGRQIIKEDFFPLIDKMNDEIGQMECASLSKGSIVQAQEAPVQNLFLKRFKKDSRVDQWYHAGTSFNLPGIEDPVPWSVISSSTWEINGRRYDTTIEGIIKSARDSLSFSGESEAYMVICHGDDHAGNIRLTSTPSVFDPAFAGTNPASLNVKALAHTGFLPLAAMYYRPKGLLVEYDLRDTVIMVNHNMHDLPGYGMHERLAKQIIDRRIIPVIDKIKKSGGDVVQETRRIKDALAGCALLTVNMSTLLSQRDGRAVGLLPMSVMFNSLSGLSMLDYLGSQLKKQE